MPKAGKVEKEKDTPTVLIPEVVESGLSRRHEAVLVALLANATIKGAAEAAGVNESTVWRLMQREDFQKRFRDAQDKVFDGALGSLQGASSKAVETLTRNLSCGVPAAEVQAAKVILDYTIKARELFDHGARLRAIEEALKRREDAERKRLGEPEPEVEDEDDDDF